MQARLDRAIDRAFEDRRITGTVVLVEKEGQRIYERVAGFADREAKKPVRSDTIFRLASVTKPIVAATALAMIEKRIISLNDALVDHLPWLHPVLIDGRQPIITVHHLLTHTAGFVYDPALEHLPADRAVNCGLADTDLDFEANFSRLNAVPLAFAPGTQWAYSFATDILGAIIAARHGGTLEDAVTHYIAAPLNMDDCRFHVTDPERLAVPYADDSHEPFRMPDPYVPPMEGGWSLSFSPSRIFNPRAFQSGGAGMAGTAGQILSFLNALGAGGKGVLRPETVAMGMSNQIGDLMAEPGAKFGYFGAIIHDRREALTPHSLRTVRWGGVYGLNWFIDPVEKLTAISVTNNAVEGCMGAYPSDIVNAIYGV